MAAEGNDLGLARGLVLADPTERWIDLFAQEAAALNGALHSLGARVEHCGSTSVPGMPAKPILDILVGVPEELDVELIKQALAPLGYEHATWAGVPGNEVLGKGFPRTHLLHVVPLGGLAWDRMLRFRNALRSDAALAADYAALKRQLATQHPSDRSAYTEGKSDFIERVLTR